MKTFAQYPILLFLLITFGWTWLFWLAAIPLRGQTLLVMTIVLIGGYGPFIGGILTLGLKSGLRFSLPPQQLVTMGIATVLIFGVLALRYWVGNRPNYGMLAADLTLSVPIVLAALVASLVGALGAALLLGLVWAVWHFIPLWEAHRSVVFIAWWSLGTVTARVIITWLYNNTGRSVFVAALFHTMINLTWQLFPVNGSYAYYDPRVAGLLTLAVAVVVVIVWGPRTLVRTRNAPG